MDLIATARELEAMAQTGLHFAQDEYDRERYERLREIAAEMIADCSNLSSAQVLDWNRAEFGYATPKVDVRAFIPRDDHVLLVRENQDEGRWTLPGGWADVNDSPSGACAREVREESGYEVTVDRLLAVYDRERQGHTPPYPFHIYKIFFLCSITGGAPRANRESSECRFFPVNDLPELSLSRVLPEQIRKLHQICTAQDGGVADFD
jgi:ADP-ribose pyrophosphatase YjhB (NUDIX family)